MEKTMGELKIGDKVWNSGVLFEVQSVKIYPAKDCGAMADVVRYVGKVVGGDMSLVGTFYDMGVYGGLVCLPVTCAD
jgi:hypothetical protein